MIRYKIMYFLLFLIPSLFSLSLLLFLHLLLLLSSALPSSLLYLSLSSPLNSNSPLFLSFFPSFYSFLPSPYSSSSPFHLLHFLPSTPFPFTILFPLSPFPLFPFLLLVSPFTLLLFFASFSSSSLHSTLFSLQTPLLPVSFSSVLLFYVSFTSFYSFLPSPSSSCLPHTASSYLQLRLFTHQEY